MEILRSTRYQRVVINARAKGENARWKDAGIRAVLFESQDPGYDIYPVEVRYEAITGHVAQ